MLARYLELAVYLVTLGAAVIVFARVAGDRAPRSLGWLVGLVAAGAWTLRRWVSPQGPGDLHLGGTSTFFTPGNDALFGATPSALGNAARRLGPTDFGCLISLNTALGAAASALLVATFAPINRLVGVTAGLLLATLPIALRFGADLSAMGAVLFFASASLLAVVETLDAPTRWRAALGGAMLPGTLLLLAQTRPEALVGLSVVALAIVVLPAVSRARRAVAAGAFALAALLVLEHAHPLRQDLAFTRRDFLANHWSSGVLALSAECVPLAFPWLIAAAVWPGAGGPAARLRLWGLAAALASGAMTFLSMSAFTADRITSARYHFAFVPALCVAASCGVARVHALGARIGGSRGATGAMIAIVAWLAVDTARLTRAVVAPRGIDEEFLFLQAALRAVPDGATIGFVPRGLLDCPMDVGFANPELLSRDLRRRHHWVALGGNVALAPVDHVYRGPRCDADWDRLSIRTMGCYERTRAVVERACAEVRRLEGEAVARRERLHLRPLAFDYVIGDTSTLVLSRVR